MEKLVLNGEIYLDGTLPKYVKEKSYVKNMKPSKTLKKEQD